MSELYEKAVRYATEKHEGQVRKYTHEPYITHPLAVAEKVEKFLCEDVHVFGRTADIDTVEFAKCVAVLHDTVEDTDATHDEIVELFGKEIASGVWYLTKTESFVGNREVRKGLCEARLSRAPWIVKVVKTCDLHHNSGSIAEHDPKFAELFRTETKSLLECMHMTSTYVRLGG